MVIHSLTPCRACIGKDARVVAAALDGMRQVLKSAKVALHEQQLPNMEIVSLAPLRQDRHQRHRIAKSIQTEGAIIATDCQCGV